MDKTLLILAVELRQTFRIGGSADTKSGRTKRIARNIIGYAVFLAIAVFMGRGTYHIATALSAELVAYPNAARTVWVNLMSGLSLGIFIMLLMTGVSVVYRTLYDSGDVKLLLSTPTPAGSVVAAKLIVAFVGNLTAIVPFLYPTWVGYGAGSGAPASFYLMSLLAIILAVLFFTAVVAIFVMLVMRKVPTQRMRQIIMIGSLAVAFIFVLAFQVLNAKMARSNGLDTTALAQAAQAWGLGRAWYLPHAWVVKTALLTTSEFEFSFWESLLPLAVAAVGSFAGAISLSTKAFLAGWSASGEVETAKSKRRLPARRGWKGQATGRQIAGGELVEDVASALPDTMVRRHISQGWGIFAKDLIIIMRQPIIWYSILVAVVASGFYIYNMLYGVRSGAGGTIAGLMRNVVLFVLIMMSTISSAQMGGMCISMDGESLWLIKSMPIDPGTYFNSKVALAILPGGIVFTLLALAMAFVPDIPQYPLYLSLPVGYAAISMLGAFGVMFDAMKPDFSIRISGAGGAKKRNNPSKALITLGMRLVGTLVLGATFAFKDYYFTISALESMDRQMAVYISVIAFSVMVVTGHVIARSLAVASIKKILRGESN